MSNKPEHEKYRALQMTQEVIDALRAAAQAKGAPLSDDERKAVYATFEK